MLPSFASESHRHTGHSSTLFHQGTIRRRDTGRFLYLFESENDGGIGASVRLRRLRTALRFLSSRLRLRVSEIEESASPRRAYGRSANRRRSLPPSRSSSRRSM